MAIIFDRSGSNGSPCLLGSVTVLIAVMLLVGCTTPKATQPETISTIKAKPSPTPSDPNAEVIQLAMQTVDYYQEIANMMYRNPTSVSNEDLTKVAISSELSILQSTKLRYTETGNHRVGIPQYGKKTVTKIDLTNNVATTPPIVPHIIIRQCFDSTNADTVDKDGKSVTKPGWPKKSSAYLTVANYKYPDPTQWRVADEDVKEGEPC